MTILYNLAKVSTATTGTGTITLGSAISGYLTFAQAGVTNGQTVSYGIRDGANSEVGYGVYTASGTTLTRNVTKSTNSNAAISLSGTAEVYITARAEDIVNKTGDTMTGALTFLNTGLKIQDNDASNTLSIIPGSNLTADRTLTFTTGDTSRNITLTGNTTIPATFPTSTTDNTLPRFDGSSGSFQTSSVAIDDAWNVTGINTLDIGDADTTLSRVSAGVIAVEGSNVLMASNIGSSVQAYNANLADLTTSYNRATATGPAWLRLYEDTDNGSQYLELIAPSSIVTSNKQVQFQDASGTVYITGGTDVALADGGTGASDAPTARTNLGLGSIATQAASNVSITGGSITGITDLAVADGGTGQSSYTSGQLLIGNNSGGLTKATLTQGSGVTITNGDGSITIASTGSMVYPGAGIANSTGSAWGTSYTTSGSGTVVALATSPSFTTPALSGETFSTTNNVTAGTNAQGQGALTSDYNVITTAANNPSGVTLPTATAGRRIVIVNKGNNAVNVYPATSSYIDALAINTSIQIPVGAVMIFNASSTTQWYSSYNLTTNVNFSSGFATTSEVTGVITTGTITSGTNSLTVASASGLSQGMFVTGEGITYGTTISSISGTTITLSANANATLSSDPVTFYINNKALSPGLVGGQLCKAWVNFNGTGTVAIRASFNVSSITDIAVGQYTINFTSALPDTNYCYAGCSQRVQNVSNTGVIGFNDTYSKLTTSFPLVNARLNGGNAQAPYDTPEIVVAFFR